MNALAYDYYSVNWCQSSSDYNPKTFNKKGYKSQEEPTDFEFGVDMYETSLHDSFFKVSKFALTNYVSDLVL